ncbi:SdpA family antimicrobial peptide system protein [Paenibacillus ehimensis]|uniref:SdpA family antimicrobial peptide system protein n=1 Tax=Paenibacillus ehimensis TaxID=79264 RepID=UPI001FEC27D5|nr:SdpA family antimicrobial peptide system protein [Paenibacillus ehimensis]
MVSLKKSKHIRIGIFTSLITLFWIYIFLLAIHTALPANALTSLPLKEELKIIQWFPQGWGFYSKNPREPYFYVYEVPGNKLAGQWPNNRVDNAFGLLRFGRSQGVEAGLLTSKIPSNSLTECKENPVECLNQLQAIEVENPSPFPTICGDVGFVYQEPIPWAWSKGGEETVMPSKLVRVKVACSQKSV